MSSQPLELIVSIIHAALNLPSNPNLPAHPLLVSRSAEAIPPKARMRRSIILEAEVVPYNESFREGGRGPGIEEFWHLGAAGVTPDTTQQGQKWKNRNRHLCLVFFDVLHLDGRNLLDTRYDNRRDCLERVIKVVPWFVSYVCESVDQVTDGKSHIVERVEIPLWKSLSVARAVSQPFSRTCELLITGT
jgi:DNA ligase-4